MRVLRRELDDPLLQEQIEPATWLQLSEITVRLQLRREKGAEEMSLDLWIDRAILGIVVALLAVGLTRAIFLYSKGVRVLVVDWHKSVARALCDTLALVVLVTWFYEVVAHGIPLAGHNDPWGLGGSVVRNPWFRSAGLAIVAGGSVLYIVALFALGRSWRVGIDAGNSGPLVTTGLYGWSRHPIYGAFLLIFTGTFLALDDRVMLLLGAAACVIVHLNALTEEHFLTDIYGGAYREYSRSVGRYVTLACKPRS